MLRINRISYHNFRNILDSTIYLAEKGFQTDLGGHIAGIYGINGSSKSSVGYSMALLTKLICGISLAFFHNFDNDFGIYDDYMSLEYDFDYLFENYYNGIIISFEFRKTIVDKEEKVYMSKETIKIKSVSGRPSIYSIPRDYNYLNCLIESDDMNRIKDLFNSSESIIYALNSSSILNQRSFFLNLENIKNVLDNYSKTDDKLEVNPKFAYIVNFVHHYCKDTAFIMPDLYGTSITNNIFAMFSEDFSNTQFLVKSPNGAYQCNKKTLEKIETIIETSNKFMSKIINDFAVIVEKKEYSTNDNGETIYQIRLLSSKNNKTFLFENESEGIKRLFLISSSIARVMNDSDCILFVDELDEGIFEVLFGDIVEGISNQCMGQFIFTSHNLRPLEMVDSSHFIFSTTNPRNRFVTLKGIKPKNNLRDIYIRKIMYGSEDDLAMHVDENDILEGLIS